MGRVYVAGLQAINRRSFLRGVGGAALTLPHLDAMAVGDAAGRAVPMRMVCVGLNFGFIPQLFFPKQQGAGYDVPELLEPLARHRRDFTVISGLDHGVNAKGGHGGIHAYLSGVLSKNSTGYSESNISVDQKAAQIVGAATRYPSLQLATGFSSNNLLSWTPAGVAIPPISNPETIFSLLFQKMDRTAVSAREARYAAQSSILDLVKTDADRLLRQVGQRDRDKLEQYFTSVRALERRLNQSQQWLHRPKPSVDYALRQGANSLNFVDRVPLYYDLMALALQTDSTRIVTLASSDIGANYGGFDVTRGYHQLTHHGKVAAYIDELKVIERFHTNQFARFLDQLKSINEPNGKTLLDNTMALLGSGMGNASSHSNRNLPLLLAGGGFRHGEHQIYPQDRQGRNVTPAANLFVSMLQRFGLETDRFNTATGSLSGLQVG